VNTLSGVAERIQERGVAKKKKRKAKPPGAEQPPVARDDSTGSRPRLLSRVSPSWFIVAILVVGTVLRLWGINERHFGDTDTSNHWSSADMYRVAWDWYKTGAHEDIGLMEYKEREMGLLVLDHDGGKPLLRLLRALAILITGHRSIVAYSLMDIMLGVGAMILMLRWCYRALGPRIALLAACLWATCGSQFASTGRGYGYSGMAFFASLAWVMFMQRDEKTLYMRTFVAGIAIGAATTCHYNCLNFVPLCLVFILLFRNRHGFLGKLGEMAAFGCGIMLPLVCIWLWYAGLTALTGARWSHYLIEGWSWVYRDQGPGVPRVGPRFLPNEWFIMWFLNGPFFLPCLCLGIVVAAILHLKRYGWRWSICDDPLFILCGVASFGLVLWGLYYYKVPRTRMLELAAWPVLGALGIYHATTFLTGRWLKGRWLTALQVAIAVVIMTNQWFHTKPMLKMGSGIRKAMMAMTAADGSATGEGDFWAWPCTMKVKNPVKAPVSRWESLDDFIEQNGYDYYYMDYARIVSFIVTYPGAGQHLMLDTYNRLIDNVLPVWSFEYGGPIHAGLEHDRITWLKQWYTWERWRELNPNPTSFDKLIRKNDYFDVYRASDVVRAFRQSRVNLLAQLMIIQQRDPQEFNRIMPRLHGWLQYTTKDEDVVGEARRLALQRTGG